MVESELPSSPEPGRWNAGRDEGHPVQAWPHQPPQEPHALSPLLTATRASTTREPDPEDDVPQPEPLRTLQLPGRPPPPPRLGAEREIIFYCLKGLFWDSSLTTVSINCNQYRVEPEGVWVEAFTFVSYHW